MGKFKQYWLYKDDEADFTVYEEPISASNEFITHVIEYSAYKEVLAELSSFRNSLEVAEIAEQQMVADIARRENQE